MIIHSAMKKPSSILFCISISNLNLATSDLRGHKRIRAIGAFVAKASPRECQASIVPVPFPLVPRVSANGLQEAGTLEPPVVGVLRSTQACPRARLLATKKLEANSSLPSEVRFTVTSKPCHFFCPFGLLES